MHSVVRDYLLQWSGTWTLGVQGIQEGDDYLALRSNTKAERESFRLVNFLALVLSEQGSGKQFPKQGYLRVKKQ